MVDPPEKLSNDHAHNTQSFRLANAIVELSEHGSEPRAIGKLESFAGQLIERLAQGSAMESVISSAAAVLQSADEMKMAELNDPALACAEFDNTRNLVGDRGTDTMAWLDRHHIQDPIFFLKSEIKSVQDQNQGALWQAHGPRSRCELSQSSTKPPTQPLVGKTIAWSESFQCASVEQHCFESSRTRSPRLAAALFLADPPRTLALTALTTSGTEVINFRSATSRFRVPRMHARELHTD